jgi:hypothetical protein
VVRVSGRLMDWVLTSGGLVGYARTSSGKASCVRVCVRLASWA